MDRVENTTERPEDTVRRFARRLCVLEELVDAELDRLRADDLFPAGRLNFLRRRWLDGVRTARAVSEQRLLAIKNAFYDDPTAGGEGD